MNCGYGKCSKISNTSFSVLKLNLVFSWAGIHKMLVRIANREDPEMLVRIANRKDPDQKTSSEAVWSGSALFV